MDSLAHLVRARNRRESPSGLILAQSSIQRHKPPESPPTPPSEFQDSVLTTNLKTTVLSSTILNSKIQKEKTKRRKYQQLYYNMKSEFKKLQLKYEALKQEGKEQEVKLQAQLTDRRLDPMSVSDFLETDRGRNSLIKSVYHADLIDLVDELEASY